LFGNISWIFLQPLAWLLQKGFPAFTKKLWPSRFFLHSSVLYGVIFAKNPAPLGIETFTLHVVFAERAVEALRMVVIIKSLNPAIPCLYWEATRDAFCREQLVPIFFAVR